MEEGGDPPPSASRSTSSRKRSRPSEAAAAAVADDDLISALPDAVILHVLSFIDIKDVVKTSALSRRWSSLWTQTSAVSINFCYAGARYGDVFNFFDRFFLQCTSPAIRKLHLRGLSDHNGLKERIEHWIRFAVGRRVEDLCIDLLGDEVDVLSRSLLRCESLTRLRLKSCGFSSFTNCNLGMISWSSLKVLSVSDTKMVDEVINGVLEGSPQLESLTLDACYGMNSIRIFSRKMRELVIHRYFSPRVEFSDEGDENGRNKNFCLEIFVPYLRSMQLLGWWVGKEVIVLRQVLSLVEVELNFSLTFDKSNLDIIYDTMKGILTELRFVDKFVIGNEILMDLHKYNRNGDSFLWLNCRQLTITTLANKHSLGRIAEVLECAPNVEKLVVDFVPKIWPKGIFTHEGCRFNEEIFLGTLWKSLTCHIKNIEIIVFPACACTEPIHWLSLIEVLLRDELVLEKMVVDVKSSWTSGIPLELAPIQDLFEVAEDVLGYPRGSKAAKVVLNYPFKRKKSSARST